MKISKITEIDLISTICRCVNAATCRGLPPADRRGWPKRATHLVCRRASQAGPHKKYKKAPGLGGLVRNCLFMWVRRGGAAPGVHNSFNALLSSCSMSIFDRSENKLSARDVAQSMCLDLTIFRRVLARKQPAGPKISEVVRSSRCNVGKCENCGSDKLIQGPVWPRNFALTWYWVHSTLLH